MNALDVLVTPRASAATQAPGDAASTAEPDATSGAFIALLGAMLGAAPVVAPKAPVPLALVLADGEAQPDGSATAAEANAEEPQGDGVPNANANANANVNALVSDSEMVGIARAALAIMKGNANATRPSGNAARSVNAIPLTRLARNAARQAERVGGEKVSAGKAAEKKAAKPSAQVVATEAGAPSSAPAVPEQLATQPTPTTAVSGEMLAQANGASQAAVILAPDVGPITSDVESASSTPSPDVMASTRGTASAPVMWTPAPAPVASTGAAGTPDSALVHAVTQLIDALTAADPTRMPTIEHAPELSSAHASEQLPIASSSQLPTGIEVTQLEIADASGKLSLPQVETTRVAESAVSPMTPVTTNTSVSGESVGETGVSAAVMDRAQVIATQVDGATDPMEATRPTFDVRERAPAHVAGAAADRPASDRDSASHGHAGRERERTAKPHAVAEGPPRWSPVSGGVAAAPATADATVPAPLDVAAAHAPEEPVRTAQPTSHVTLQLDSDTLGASRIRVAVRGDTVRATILADDGKAAALTAQLPELRRALEERGFTEARVVIQVEGNHEGKGPVIAGAMTDDLRARPAASTRSESGREDQQPRGGRRQDPDGDRPRDRRRQAPKEEAS